MTALAVSVVVVSRDRPALLQRCLRGLFQLGYPKVEIIVASNADGIEAVNAVDPENLVKRVYFNTANISEARNRACDQAAGAVIAFIDDDAVPEPTWLDHLVAPFQDPRVGVAGGFVRGRNGISWQWRGRIVGRDGFARALSLDDMQTTVFAPPKEGAVKTEGTNMAVRRAALVGLGGFDPAFRFFFDETDLNIRLTDAGWYSAIAPMAQVHHGYAASARRRADRAPTDLSEIGASWSVFLKKHGKSETPDVQLRIAATQERSRAIKWMQSGGLDALDVAYLMRSFWGGVSDGATRTPGQGHIAETSPSTFSAWPTQRRRHTILSGWIWDASNLQEAAKQASGAGDVVTTFLFSPSALFHQHRFVDDGYWLQTGGLWGKSERSQPLVTLRRFADRVRGETERLWGLRALHVSNEAKKSDK